MTNEQEQGSALIWAILFSIIVSGMIVTHAVYMSAHRREMDTRYHRSSLSGTFARSGLTDALSWFQSQEKQPVKSFNPKFKPGATPPIEDTIDPDMGLVREFEIRGNLWGRYEVRKSEVLDISATRGQENKGTVWELGARGVVYRKVDPSKPYNVKPNRIVTMSVMRTEMRGVKLDVPAPAAVNVASPSSVFVESNGTVSGTDKPAFAYDAANALDIPNATVGVVSGTPAVVNVSGFDAAPHKVFAMRMEELKAYADSIVDDNGDAPKIVREGKVVFVGGTFTLKAGRSYRGRNQLIVIAGDLVAEAGNDTNMSGLIYVSGNATIRGPFLLKGMMVVGGNFTIGGSASAAEIVYDQKTLTKLARKLSRYRLSRIKSPGIGIVEPVGDPVPEIDPSGDISGLTSAGQFLRVKANSAITGGVTIEDNVRIDENCHVKNGVHIMSNVRIERDNQITGPVVMIHENCIIEEGCQISGNVIIHPGARVSRGTILTDGMEYGAGADGK